jgi:hypothetical protein
MVVRRSWRLQACVQSALQAVQRLVLVEWVLAMAACWWRGCLTHLLDASGAAAGCQSTVARSALSCRVLIISASLQQVTIIEPDAAFVMPHGLFDQVRWQFHCPASILHACEEQQHFSRQACRDPLPLHASGWLDPL